jgi:hypothetical protein
MNNLQLWIGVGFALLLIVFFMAAYFVPPARTAQTGNILRVLASALAGAAGAFLSGGVALEVRGDLSIGANWILSATGGAALFALVWLTWSHVNRPGFHIAFPLGTTFAAATTLIASAAGNTVRRIGFSPAEDNTELASLDLMAKDPRDALAQLSNHLPSGSVRPYEVREIPGGFELRP